MQSFVDQAPRCVPRCPHMSKLYRRKIDIDEAVHRVLLLLLVLDQEISNWRVRRKCVAKLCHLRDLAMSLPMKLLACIHIWQ